MGVEIRLPAASLVQLCAPPGCGKSTFARRHFRPTQIVSSDQCREMVCDDVNNMEVHSETFSLVRHIVRLRMSLGKLTVIDATSLRKPFRKQMIALARTYRFHAAIIILDVDLERCIQRNLSRDRRVDPEVIRDYHRQLQKTKESVFDEGFDSVFVLSEGELLEVRVILEGST